MLEDSRIGETNALVCSLKPSEKEGVFSILSCYPSPRKSSPSLQFAVVCKKYVENSMTERTRTERCGGGGRKQGEKGVARGEEWRCLAFGSWKSIHRSCPNPQEVEAQRGQVIC